MTRFAASSPRLLAALSLLAVAGRDHPVALGGQVHLEAERDALVVFDHEDRLRRGPWFRSHHRGAV